MQNRDNDYDNQSRNKSYHDTSAPRTGWVIGGLLVLAVIFGLAYNYHNDRDLNDISPAAGNSAPTDYRPTNNGTR